MDDEPLERKNTRGDVLVTAAFAFAIVVVIVSPQLFSALAAIAYSAVAILVIVRWFNRRDDPQNCKRPPDPP